MRLLIFTTICFLAFFANVSAQKAPPVSKAAKSYELVSDEGGFRAKFPAAPQKSSKMIDSAFGKTEYTTFQHTSVMALHMVAYFDYPTAIKDRTELGLLYDQVKGLMTARRADARVIEEREVMWGEYLGRDYLIEVDKITLTLRCLVIQQRLFQLMVSTPGSLSKATPAVKKYHQKLADDFFNSFAVTKLPAPKTVPVELPADFGVKIENNVFRSDFFKFTITLPKDWKLLDETETQFLSQVGLQETKEQLPGSAKQIEFSSQNTKFLAAVMKDEKENPAILMIAAERISIPNFLPSAVTESYLKNLLEPNEEVVSKTALTKFGGTDFAWLETRYTDSNAKQRLYVANRGGIAFQISISYTAPGDLQILLKSLESIRFEETENIK